MDFLPIHMPSIVEIDEYLRMDPSKKEMKLSVTGGRIERYSFRGFSIRAHGLFDREQQYGPKSTFVACS